MWGLGQHTLLGIVGLCASGNTSLGMWGHGQHTSLGIVVGLMGIVVGYERFWAHTLMGVIMSDVGRLHHINGFKIILFK
jgi:hypothetical protein